MVPDANADRKTQCFFSAGGVGGIANRSEKIA
jgi:hypothetical protein